jgi:hypothetical protein
VLKIYYIAMTGNVACDLSQSAGHRFPPAMQVYRLFRFRESPIPTIGMSAGDETKARDAMINRTTFEEDPYEADSDHEYESLETDATDEDDVRAQAEEFEDVDQTRVFQGDDDVELAAPPPVEDRERIQDLEDRLDDVSFRDPEAIAADDARRHAIHPDALQAPLDRMMDRTPFDTDDLEMEALLDADDDSDDHTPEGTTPL